jgi:hypothetical protein
LISVVQQLTSKILKLRRPMFKKDSPLHMFDFRCIDPSTSETVTTHVFIRLGEYFKLPDQPWKGRAMQ